jgi:hypothetical protein
LPISAIVRSGKRSPGPAESGEVGEAVMGRIKPQIRARHRGDLPRKILAGNPFPPSVTFARHPAKTE